MKIIKTVLREVCMQRPYLRALPNFGPVESVTYKTTSSSFVVDDVTGGSTPVTYLLTQNGAKQPVDSNCTRNRSRGMYFLYHRK